MIPIPVAIWTALNALNCISAATMKGGSRIGFALALGTAALSCGLLSAGFLTQFLMLEIIVWILNMMIVIIATAVRPPGAFNEDVNNLAVGASIKVSIAMIVWLSL